jgi:hypothetical protein
VAVPVDETGTVSVVPKMAPPVPGVQKPPHRVEKRFRDRLVAAPEKRKVKRLQTRGDNKDTIMGDSEESTKG